MIGVDINFTPIHKFNPSIQSLDNIDGNVLFDNNSNIEWGNQKYITLRDDEGNDGYRQKNTAKQQSNITIPPSVTKEGKIEGSVPEESLTLGERMLKRREERLERREERLGIGTQANILFSKVKNIFR